MSPHLNRSVWQHQRYSRRAALQAGSVGLLGLGMNHVAGLRQLAAENGSPAPVRSKSVIYIFLSGGLTQHESFDPKPDAPDSIRGEFAAIETKTPGFFISEHLPRLASRSDRWAVVRSLTHPYNDHSTGHHVMLTGRTEKPIGFDGNKPTQHDYPSFPSIVQGVVPARNNLPPAAVLPWMRVTLARGIARRAFFLRVSTLRAERAPRALLAGMEILLRQRLMLRRC